MAKNDDEIEDLDDFGAMLAAFESEQGDAVSPTKGRGPQVGDKVTGTIEAIGTEVAFVELGGKAEGLVAVHELADEDGVVNAAVGDKVTGVVSSIDASGALVLRVRAGRGEALREELRLAFEQQLPVEGLVAATVKGGLEVTVGGVRAFCPVSQIADTYVQEPGDFVGQRLEFRIQRFEEKGRHTNIVVSRRVLLEEEKARRAEAVRAYLEVDAIVEGTVTSVTSYGAFVDLGGLEGLLHVSEMSHQRLDDPAERVSVGQRLEVQITKIEPPHKEGQTERISLSIKALQKDPWEDAERRFPADKVLTGRVMRLETYGAFVELAPGLEGLVHISKLGAAERLSHARQVLELGQEVQVKVLGVDTDKRRISLAREVATEDDGAREAFQEYRENAGRQGEGFGGGSFAGLGRLKKK